MLHFNHTIKPFSFRKFLGNKAFAEVGQYHVGRWLSPASFCKPVCRVLDEAEVKMHWYKDMGWGTTSEHHHLRLHIHMPGIRQELKAAGNTASPSSAHHTNSRSEKGQEDGLLLFLSLPQNTRKTWYNILFSSSGGNEEKKSYWPQDLCLQSQTIHPSPDHCYNSGPVMRI